MTATNAEWDQTWEPAPRHANTLNSCKSSKSPRKLPAGKRGLMLSGGKAALVSPNSQVEGWCTSNHAHLHTCVFRLWDKHDVTTSWKSRNTEDMPRSCAPHKHRVHHIYERPDSDDCQAYEMWADARTHCCQLTPFSTSLPLTGCTLFYTEQSTSTVSCCITTSQPGCRIF